ncbi:hypothetical protein RIF29_34078 [Crotalaria pallida]|uniref:Uncharacterized protein n=1 Tax=Crotalaria pallida TaxID=3830 RepID=A0AAN9E924_CROPI
MADLEEKMAYMKNQPSTMLPEKEEVLNAAISRVDVLEQELQATKKEELSKAVSENGLVKSGKQSDGKKANDKE